MKNIKNQEDNILNLRRVEIIDDIVYMSPSPSVKHNKIMFRITAAFETYLRKKTCSVHQVCNIYYNPDKPKNHVIPDVSVMCEPEKFTPNGYNGVPSLIVEILSTNRKDDLSTKFRLYEKIGVKEYWIVEPLIDTINQYILINGQYELLEAYQYMLPDEIETLDEIEQERYQSFIKPSIFTDFEIALEDIFED
ncbi:MAG: hypothetical protein ATN35_10220 [Epulopiscium sp. Nele67-Bin004]|nr:MAG: hypothetical protein ATN35_10220 [Epulopiscium sp. Nele67-Bin004]